MNPLLMKLLARYQAPAGDDGSDTGGTGSQDRGDDFTPTEGDEDAPKSAEKPAAKTSDDTDSDPEGQDGEEEGEDDDKEKDKKAEAKGKKDSRIPLSRHKDIVEKERARRQELERQLAAYQKGSEVAELNEDITKVEDNILKMEKEYAKLISDGETDKAVDLMAKIRKAERQVSETKSDMKIAAAEARATENARYNLTLERIESAYPALNEDHEDFDADMVADVLDLKAAYQARRNMTPSAALQAAVEKLLGKKGAKQQAAVDVTPRVSAKDVAAERKEAAVKKAVDTVKRSPPDMSAVGKDSDKMGGGVTAREVMKMSQAEFNKLDERTLAQMRGDEL